MVSKIMGLSKYLTKVFQNEWKGTKDEDYNYKSLMQKRAMEYRKETKSVIKIDKPTNLVSAKQVGYKAKQGVFVVRAKIRKGSGTFTRPKNKRRPKRQGQATLTRRKSTRSMAEERVSKKFENAEVLGSYKIAEDGRSHYFEVVMADREAARVGSDKKLVFLFKGQQGRAERGKTFAGRVNKEENKKTKRKKIAKKKITVKNNGSK
jgi:large subunit ribosomal protein L15e